MKQFILATILAGAIAVPALAADYKIMAPAAPGGGWDQTARSMQTALQDEKISGNVQVTNVPGAGGTIGLAQFVSEASGDPTQLIVGGYVMVGAILTNASPVTLDQVTPIARLTGEYEAIVVPAASDIKAMADLVAKLKADPGSVSWAGGSAGGTDHITAGLITKAVGRRSDQGQLRALFRRRRGAGRDAQRPGDGRHFRLWRVRRADQGRHAAHHRHLVATPRSKASTRRPSRKAASTCRSRTGAWSRPLPTSRDEQKAAIIADIEKMNASPAWQKTLADKGWANTFLAGDAFTTQLRGYRSDTRRSSRISAWLNERGQ